jgi:hypothetical protein
VEPGYGVGLVEDDYLFLLPAADLRMDPTLRPRLVSSVAFACLGNALQLDYSIERRYILLKLEIKRVVSITRKQKVKMAVTIYVKGLSHSSKLRNYLGVYIHRSLPS